MKILLQHVFKRLICFLAPAILFTIMTYAQEPPTCAEKLQSAQSFFERGQVEQVPALISDCLESGFNREESLQAYKLIIQTYLFNEKFEKADSAMLAFLKKYPEYEISTTDHSSFVSLFNNFASKIIIQVSLHIGTNKPFPFVSFDKSLLGVPGEQTHSSKATNFFISLEAKYRITDKIELNVEPGYSQLNFSQFENVNFAEISFKEVQQRIEIPLTATYDVMHLGKFVPYARLGAGPVFNLVTYGIGEVDPNDVNNPFIRTGENIKNLSRRFIDFSMQAGAGIKYKIREGFFCAEIRSNFGGLNQAEKTTYDGEYLDKDFYYMAADDHFSLNTLSFTVGYTRIFYKPVRRED